MLVIKKFIVSDEVTDFASKVFDKVITNTGIHFTSLEFCIRDSTFSEMKGTSGILHIDYQNQFLQEKDERAVKTIIARQIFKIMFPDSDEVSVNSEMIKRGYYDDLFYLYYRQIEEMNPIGDEEYDFLSACLETFRNKDDNTFLRNALDNKRRA